MDESQREYILFGVHLPGVSNAISFMSGVVLLLNLCNVVLKLKLKFTMTLYLVGFPLLDFNYFNCFEIII